MAMLFSWGHCYVFFAGGAGGVQIMWMMKYMMMMKNKRKPKTKYDKTKTKRFYAKYT
jgi:hypothetical protein